MIVRQFLHHEPVGISYLIGCAGHAAGAVIDPVGDLKTYLRTAQETGLKLRSGCNSSTSFSKVTS